MKPLYSLQLILMLRLIMFGEDSGWIGVIQFIILILITIFNLHTELIQEKEQ